MVTRYQLTVGEKLAFAGKKVEDREGFGVQNEHVGIERLTEAALGRQLQRPSRVRREA